jgi:hypothetical protein
VITKVLVSAIIVLGSVAGGTPLAGADPNPTDSPANPFGSLGCSCQETPPADSPGLKTQLDRGLWTGLSSGAHEPSRS